MHHQFFNRGGHHSRGGNRGGHQGGISRVGYQGNNYNPNYHNDKNQSNNTNNTQYQQTFNPRGGYKQNNQYNKLQKKLFITGITIIFFFLENSPVQP